MESADGGKVVVCSFHTVCTGRRPDGYEPPALDDRAPLLGRYFAAMAADEAASVVAFGRMALELAEHGMPAYLAELARRSALEEERHFRIAAGLSQRFGVRATRGRVAAQGARTLLDLAVENARAGVVEETLGAIMGYFQAQHAHEAVVRRAMRQIAREEASHAVLSWRVDASARERLSISERGVLDRARDDALRDVAHALEAPVPDVLAERAGVPPPSVARALMVEARTRLFGG